MKFDLPFTITIEKLNHDGYGVGQERERDILVPYTMVGDKIKVNRVFKRKKRYNSLDFEVLERTAKGVPPLCDHFGQAGGCSMQHIPYKEQISFKEDKLKDILGRKVSVLPSPTQDRYRNRMDIAITPEGIGFRQRGRWWQIVNVEDCILFSERMGRSIRELKEYQKKFNLEGRHPRSGEGFLRYLVIREGKNTDEYMVNLVTSPGELPEDLDKHFTADSIYWSTTDSKSDISYGDVQKLWGKEYLTEELDGVKYEIHPNSFFQTNTSQAENMVKYVAEMVQGKTVLDLYTGVGSFAIYLAKKLNKEVKGVDINEFSIELAKRNAKLNDVDVEFEALPDSEVTSLENADTVIVDPPRPGLHPKMIELILREKPKQLIYVSCNPKTLAENLKELETIYKVQTLEGIDMFPHTPNVESVCNLTLI